MTSLAGKVAFITGVARGQGRAEALQLAQAGADVIGIDICRQIESVEYPLATAGDLAETARLVENTGRRMHVSQADIRDPEQLEAAVAAGTAQVGPIDIVVANAGVAPFSMTPRRQEWHDAIDVNLTGTYNTISAVIPAMIERDAGGSIVIISSVAGLTGMSPGTPGGLGYTASKHGLVGLMRVWANELAPHRIRVNSLHPSGVRTMMIINDTMAAFQAQQPRMSSATSNALPVDLLEPEDVANAVCWLVSDEARYVTGVAMPVDGGFVNKR